MRTYAAEVDCAKAYGWAAAAVYEPPVLAGPGVTASVLLLSGWSYVCLYGALLGHGGPLSGARLVLGAVAHAESYGLLAVLLTGKRYF